MNNRILKPGWRSGKFGNVERLAKVRNQDPLGDGIERYFILEQLEPGELRIGCIQISVQSSHPVGSSRPVVPGWRVALTLVSDIRSQRLLQSKPSFQITQLRQYHSLANSSALPRRT